MANFLNIWARITHFWDISTPWWHLYVFHVTYSENSSYQFCYLEKVSQTSCNTLEVEGTVLEVRFLTLLFPFSSKPLMRKCLYWVLGKLFVTTSWMTILIFWHTISPLINLIQSWFSKANNSYSKQSNYDTNMNYSYTRISIHSYSYKSTYEP